MLADDAAGTGAREPGGDHIILAPYRQQLRAYPPGERRPAEQAEDQGHREIDLGRRPFLRHRRGKAHVERDDRNNADDFRDALDHIVEPPAEIAGNSADDQSEHEGNQDAQNADGKRGPGGVDRARKHVAAQIVGAPEVQLGLRVRQAEEVDVGRDDAEDPGRFSSGEQGDIDALVRVGHRNGAQGHRIALGADTVDEGLRGTAIGIAEHRDLGRAVDVLCVAGRRSVGCNEFGEQAEQRHQDQEAGGDHRGPVPAEAPPDQRPLGRRIIFQQALAFLLGRFAFLVGGKRVVVGCHRHRSGSQLDARIEPREQQVRQEVHEDDHEGEQQKDRAGDIHVEVEIGPQKQFAEFGETQHHGDDRQFGEDPVDIEADGRDDRVDGKPCRVLDEQFGLRDAAGTGGDDGKLVELVRHGRAHGLQLIGDGGPGEHEGGQPQMLDQVPDLGERPGRIGILGREQATDIGAEPFVGEIEQDQREQEVGQREPEIGEDRQAVIGGRAALDGGIDADRDRDQIGDDEGGKQDAEGQPGLVADYLDHGRFEGKGLSEITAQNDAADPVEIAKHHRLVEAEVPADRLDIGFRHIDAGAGIFAEGIAVRVIAGRQFHDDEHHDRNEEHRHDHADEAFQREAQHGYPPSQARIKSNDTEKKAFPGGPGKAGSGGAYCGARNHCCGRYGYVQ